MNSKNLIIQRRKSAYKIDQNSDRYRECPNDGVSFMASHRNTIFCSEKCADEYHNQRKKVVNNESKQQEPVSSQIFSCTPDIVGLDKIQSNLKILESLDIDSVFGSEFHIEWLYAQGYDFSAFTGRNSIFKVPNNIECHYTQIGYFRLYRSDYSHILIMKT